MKTKFTFTAALAAVPLAGCVVQSIHPLFAERERIIPPGLAGTWVQKDDDKEVGVWTFTARDGRTDLLQLAHRDEKGRKATFEVAAGKIGTNVFLDFTPLDPVPGTELNDFMVVSLIPAHVFAKLLMTNNALVLVALDYEWAEKHMQENPKSIAHIWKDKRPVLTATTEELQKFVGRYANDEKVFKNPIRLVKKVGGQ
jgi:hypothetical protein